LECKKEEETITLTGNGIRNESDYAIDLYSEPRTKTTVRTLSGLVEIDKEYVNPELVYPGLIFYNDSGYKACYNFFVNGIGVMKTLERHLAEDIMTIYTIVRMRLTGTMLGHVSFGNVLDYDNKRYMIASMIYNTKKNHADLVLLQISEQLQYLVTTDDEQVVTTDDEPIIVTP